MTSLVWALQANCNFFILFKYIVCVYISISFFFHCIVYNQVNTVLLSVTWAKHHSVYMCFISYVAPFLPSWKITCLPLTHDCSTRRKAAVSKWGKISTPKNNYLDTKITYSRKGTLHEVTLPTRGHEVFPCHKIINEWFS